jgi:hypothetical protein
VELDDTDQLALVGSMADGYWNSIGGFAIRTLSGVKTIDIDYRQTGSNTARIRNARIEIWRVS